MIAEGHEGTFGVKERLFYILMIVVYPQPWTLVKKHCVVQFKLVGLTACKLDLNNTDFKKKERKKYSVPIVMQEFDFWVHTNLRVHTDALKGLLNDVHSCLICNSHKLETPKMSTSGKMICGISHDVFLHSSWNKQTTATCTIPDNSHRGNVELKKTDAK